VTGVDEAVAVKLARDVPAGTITDAGTLMVGPETIITVNGVGVIFVSVTRHRLVPLGYRVLGVHVSELKTGETSTVTFAVAELPLAVAAS
jgi:hypothetical protein